jgi:membrane protease YdiL (CAAX protease family)
MGLKAARPGTRPWPVALAGALAAVLFFALFRFRRLGPLDFWAWLSVTVVLVVALSFAIDPGCGRRLKEDLRSGPLRKVGLGLVSAVFLYAVFAAGREAALAFFPFAASGISRIYELGSGVSAVRVIFLLGLLVGPGEELFWRGFFQERSGAATSRASGFALTSLIYTSVHVASGNPMLILAAAVCGLFWGGLYLRYRSPVINIVSHAAWDLLVFVILPF